MGGWLGLVPFLTSSLDRKYLLLGMHVQQQVSNTVAVAKLIVIPAGRKKGKKARWILFVFWLTVFYKRDQGRRLETNQEMSLTKRSLREMPAPASKKEEWVSPMKSEDTTCRAQATKNINTWEDLQFLYDTDPGMNQHHSAIITRPVFTSQ